MSKTTVRAAEKRAFESAIRALPDTWLDPLLSGPRAVIGSPPYGCPDIERLITAIRERIAALQRAKEKANER